MKQLINKIRVELNTLRVAMPVYSSSIIDKLGRWFISGSAYAVPVICLILGIIFAPEHSSMPDKVIRVIIVTAIGLLYSVVDHMFIDPLFTEWELNHIQSSVDKMQTNMAMQFLANIEAGLETRESIFADLKKAECDPNFITNVFKKMDAIADDRKLNK